MLKKELYTITAIRNNLKQYIIDNNLKSLVIGVSGGIDSAICCAISNPVCKECPVYDTPIIQRYLNTKFKRNNPYNIKRERII